MAGGGGCWDERRGSSASEVGTVDGTEKKSQLCATILLLKVAQSIFLNSCLPSIQTTSLHFRHQNFLHTFLFVCHVLFQFLCNLQRYCNSAYNKLNSLQQKEFINITKMNYIWRKKNRRERRRQTHMHSRMHARTNTRTHTHTHTQIPN